MTKFAAYGVEVQTTINLPVTLPESKGVDQFLSLFIKQADTREMGPLEYRTPISTLHGKIIRLSTNLPPSYPRSSKERFWNVEIGKDFLFTWGNTTNHLEARFSVSEPNLTKLFFWLLHTVIPLYLISKESSFFLHASAIEFGGTALLFLAPSFGGKSTLANMFVQKGHRLISDDKIRLKPINRHCLAFPSYPYRRHVRGNEKLGDFTQTFRNEPLPLKAFYTLSLEEPDRECRITPLQGLKKFKILKSSYLYEPVTISTKEMEFLMYLAGHYKVFRANVPKDMAKLSTVYETIAAHAMQLDPLSR